MPFYTYSSSYNYPSDRWHGLFAFLKRATLAIITAIFTYQAYLLQTIENLQIKFLPRDSLARVYQLNEIEWRSLCSSEKYAELFKVSACTLPDITLQQLSDPSFPSTQLISQLENYDRELKQMMSQLNDGYQKFGDSKERDFASQTAHYESDRVKNVRHLIDKRINFGQYNNKRLEIYQVHATILNALKTKHMATSAKP